MNCQETRARLDDFVDRELAERQRQAVQRHLDDCSACRREENELRVLLAEARSLPGLPPRRELWPGIEERLRRGPWSKEVSRLRDRGVRRFLLAAAALVLVALTIPLLRERLEPQGDLGHQTSLGDPTAELAALALLARSEDGVLSTRRDLLEAALPDRRPLAPEALAAIESSVRALDTAIGEIRAALESSPDDRHLSLLLASRYQQEVVLLKRLNRV
ncbi:MAG: anti-sigma factor [Thermoanaerobaculia bacterium]